MYNYGTGPPSNGEVLCKQTEKRSLMQTDRQTYRDTDRATKTRTEKKFHAHTKKMFAYKEVICEALLRL